MSNPLLKARKNHGASSPAAADATRPDARGLLTFDATPPHEPPYQVNLTEFADGPKPGSRAHSEGDYNGRPDLIGDFAPLLRTKLSSHAMGTTQGTKNSLRSFWRFLDTLPPGAAPKRLAEVDDLIGALWLRAEPPTEMYKKVRSLVVDARRAAGLGPVFWPPPPRHDPSDSAPVCQIGMRRLYHALKAEADETLKHRSRGLELAGGGRDPGPVGSPEWGVIENQAWALRQGPPMSDLRPFDHGAMAACCAFQRRPLFSKGKDRTPFFTKLAWFYPNRTQAAVFHLLFTMQSGWNQETVDSLDVSAEHKWLSDHPNDPKLGVLKAVKGRVQRQQIALSLRRPRFHMVRLVEAMVEMTTLLRVEVGRQAEEAEVRLASSPGDIDLRRRVESLRDKAKSPWLYLGNYGWEGSNPVNPSGWVVSTPDCDDLNRTLRSVIERHGVRDAEGKLLDLTVSDLRDAWIGYAYQRSGYSWLVAKLAAGHQTAATLRAYLRQKQWRVHGERQIRKLQDAIWCEIRARRVVDGAVLRMMVDRGEITPDQRARWETHKDRTRMGMGCRDPRRPPASVAPNHVDGTVCRVQRCVLCRLGILFPDSLDGLARRQAELIHIRETMPLPMWLQSTWSDEAEALDASLKLFDAEEVKARSDRWLAEIRAGNVHVFDQEGDY